MGLLFSTFRFFAVCLLTATFVVPFFSESSGASAPGLSGPKPFSPNISLTQACDVADAALLHSLTQLGISPNQVRVFLREDRFQVPPLPSMDPRKELWERFNYLRLQVALDGPLLEQEFEERLSEALEKSPVQVRRIKIGQQGFRLVHLVLGEEILRSIVLADATVGLADDEDSGDEGMVPASQENAAAPKPCLTIIIDDLGSNMRSCERLLSLNFPITASILPHTRYAGPISTLFRDAGYEVFLHLPMEPMQKSKGEDFALSVGMDAQSIRGNLDWALGRVPDAVGLNNHTGSRFSSHVESAQIFCDVLKTARPDLLLVDSYTHGKSVLFAEGKKAGLVAFQRDFFLDANIVDGTDLTHQQAIAEVLQQLDKAKLHAIKYGRAIAIGHPLPATLAALKQWQGWQQGLTIGPLAPEKIFANQQP